MIGGTQIRCFFLLFCCHEFIHSGEFVDLYILGRMIPPYLVFFFHVMCAKVPLLGWHSTIGSLEMTHEPFTIWAKSLKLFDGNHTYVCLLSI
jgi:hypothetical protein